MQVQQWPDLNPAAVLMAPLPRMPEPQGRRSMATEQVDRSIVTQQPTPSGGQETVRTSSRQTTGNGPEGAERSRRIVVLVFGLIQLIIGIRFVLLLLDAREANGLVSGILDFSQLFVAPFEGILRTDALQAAGSIFDITAIVALVGWTIVEMVVIWGLSVFRRQPA